jgi:hypothetical protein
MKVEVNTKPKKFELEVQRSPHIGRSAGLGTLLPEAILYSFLTLLNDYTSLFLLLYVATVLRGRMVWINHDRGPQQVRYFQIYTDENVQTGYTILSASPSPSQP